MSGRHRRAESGSAWDAIVRALLWREAAASTRLDRDPDVGTFVVEEEPRELDEEEST